jgi:RNA polymerase sigma-70 factor (sigma-E family)
LEVVVSGRTKVVEETSAEPSQSAMAELYARYVPAGIRLAYLLTGDPQRAEDLVHDAFVRCVGRFAHLRAQTAFDAYLRRTIVNVHTSRIRHRYVEREWLRREGPREVRATASLPDVATREDLWRALGTLPPRQRAALVLRYYEDLSEADAATALGCSVAAVKSLVARGADALRTRIAEGDER